MSLIVEDGSGIDGAESYVSVADATTYFTAYKSSTDAATWTGSATADQERALRLAAQFMLATYRQRWIGTRANISQSLDWPRYSAWVDENLIDSTVVPTEVQQAQCELAFKALSESLVSDESAGDSGIASESNSVAGISSSATYIGSKTTQKRYTLVGRILGPFLESGSDIVRG